MRALTALTIFMGILILAGLAIVTVTIIRRSIAPEPAVPAALSAAAAGHAAVSLPPGARVTGMVAVGDRLALSVAVADRSDLLILLDPATGTVLETIDLVPQPLAVSP